MKATKPACDPKGFYTAKQACLYLEISSKTFKKYRDMRLIEQSNPENVHRPLFPGHEIIKCWEAAVRL